MTTSLLYFDMISYIVFIPLTIDLIRICFVDVNRSIKRQTFTKMTTSSPIQNYYGEKTFVVMLLCLLWFLILAYKPTYVEVSSHPLLVFWAYTVLRYIYMFLSLIVFFVIIPILLVRQAIRVSNEKKH